MVVRVVTIIALLFTGVCVTDTPAYIAKGNPNIAVKPSWHGNQLNAVGTLNGELKGNMYLCPQVVWGCYNINGDLVVSSIPEDPTCDRSEPQRVFTWGPIKAPEICRVTLSLVPRNGKKPLVGIADKPLQWN